MARVEIELPDAFAFSTEIPIRIGDVNYGGHLGNDAVLALAHEARIRFLAARGFRSELDVGGAGLIMADAAVVFGAQGRWGMTLRVEVAPVDVRTRRFDLVYLMTDHGSGQEIARAKTGMLWFDYAARKITTMPDLFRASLGLEQRVRD